jgi:hypothetical protein
MIASSSGQFTGMPRSVLLAHELLRALRLDRRDLARDGLLSSATPFCSVDLRA